MAGDKPVRRKPGPAPRGEFEHKRKTLTTRITEETRTNLEKAAEESGRSLSQEIEFRLEQSFQKQFAVDAAFGSKLRYRQMQILGMAINLIEEQMGGTWQRDEDTFQQVRDGVITFLETLGPMGLNPLARKRLTLHDIGVSPPYLGRTTVDSLLQRVREHNEAKGKS